MPPPAEMITCSVAGELIEVYVDGELEDARCEALERHVASCGSCAAELELSRQIQSGLRAMPSFDAPERVLDAVRSTAAASRPEPIRLRSARSFGGWHAALVVAATLLLAAVLAPHLVPQRAPAPVDPELNRAVREARYAFALVGKMSRRTGDTVRKEALTPHLVNPTVSHLVGPLRRSLETIQQTTTPDPEPRVTPQRSQT